MFIIFATHWFTINAYIHTGSQLLAYKEIVQPQICWTVLFFHIFCTAQIQMSYATRAEAVDDSLKNNKQRHSMSTPTANNS